MLPVLPPAVDLTLEAASHQHHYNTLSAVINHLHAKRHGYGYKYIRLALRDSRGRPWNKKRALCRHPIHGARFAPWCKLLAMCESTARSPGTR